MVDQQRFEVSVLIEAMPGQPSFNFILDRAKHVNLTLFLKEVCQLSNVKTDQELVLATQDDSRIIVDINSIEHGRDNKLKMMKMPPEIHIFKKKVLEIFHANQSQSAPIREKSAPKPNKLDMPGIPKRRGRPRGVGHFNDSMYLGGQQSAQASQKMMQSQGPNITPQIDEFYTVKAFDKTGLFTRMKRLCLMRGFEIQFPLVADSGSRMAATIKCVNKMCPFKVVFQKSSANSMEEFKVSEIQPAHNHFLRPN
jgi:hypothetical protein